MINKDKLKGYAAGLITAILLCSTVTFAESIGKTVTAFYNNIKIVINGTEIEPKDANGNVVEPFIIDGTTYLPVRAVASMLGQEVNWDGTTNTVYIGEMPEATTDYTINSEILGSFSETELATVNSEPVKGSLYNLLLVDTATASYLMETTDNYSPSGTLQTMTISGIPAAKSLADDITDNVRLLYSLYQEAEKTGFLAEESTKAELDFSWNSFIASFEKEEDFKEFLSSHAISESDFRKFMDMNTLYSVYVNKLYSDALSKTYTDKELFDTINTNYVKAKHILVSDEKLANEIIGKIKAGQSFDALVKEYGTDPGQGEDGYVFTRGEMVAEFEEAAFALAPETYTAAPVKTAYGYHIIYRYKIDEAWVAENAEGFKNSIAYNDTNNALVSIIESAVVEFKDSYEKYITTIE